MKTRLLLALCLLPVLAPAQDLFYDAQHVSGNSAGGFLDLNPAPFEVGFLPTTTAHLFQTTSGPLIDSNSIVNPNVMGYFYDAFTSAMWWNLSTVSATASGHTLLAGKVNLQSVDQLPAIDLVVDGTTAKPVQLTIRLKITPSVGTSTPGRLALLSYSAGVWSTVYDLQLTAARADTRTIPVSAHTRLRWVLARNTTAPALASISLNVDKN